jgi:hypothetical protein
MTPLFKLHVQIEGSAYTEDTSYGPRSRRDDLAEFELEVEPSRAFQIFQAALSAAIRPEPVTALTEEEAQRLRDEWTKAASS